MEYMTREEIDAVMRETLERVGAPDLVIHVEFNSRFTRRMGDARFGRFGRQHIVRFSTPLWGRATAEERRETVIHETCHIAARHIYGDHISAHGWEWKSLMRKAGAKGDRCHSVDRGGLGRKMPRVQAYCGCPNGHQITKARRTKMMRGVIYKCRACRMSLTLAPGAYRQSG